LKQFPDDWPLLYHLVELKVAGNDLCQLPKDINKLRSLASLDVSDNLLDQLPDKLAKLPSLKHLNIADNAIMQWPTNFVKLQAKVQVCLRTLFVVLQLAYNQRPSTQVNSHLTLLSLKYRPCYKAGLVYLCRVISYCR